MAVTEQDAQDYVETSDALAGFLATAQQLITRFVGTIDVPDDVLDSATLQLTQELYFRRRNPGGVVNYSGVDGAVRLSRDPMSSIYPLLRPWVGTLP